VSLAGVTQRFSLTLERGDRFPFLQPIANLPRVRFPTDPTWWPLACKGGRAGEPGATNYRVFHGASYPCRCPIQSWWFPTVNNHGGFGRWASLELSYPYDDVVKRILAVTTQYTLQVQAAR